MNLERQAWALMVGAVVLAGPRVAAAQAPPTPPPPPSASATGLDISKLPLDLQRIERQLRQTSEIEQHDGLRLRYFVDVYGRAPRIELFTPGENLSTGPVPWGAPTHRDMLDIMTPQEFRAPAMDFNALMRWLTDKVKKREAQ